MVKLKYSEMRVFDDAFAMHQGYVLNFSDRTFAEWFDDEFGITIYQPKYDINGTSKAKHLRAFIEVEDAHAVSRVLRRLWDYREGFASFRDAEDANHIKRRFFELIDRIESNNLIPSTDAIERFKKDETLDELVSAIERDVAANKPVAALDRLHTYCMKKFSHLLDERNVHWERTEPLHARVGKYVKSLNEEANLRDVSIQIIKNATGVFDKFNHVRNNQSLAHDNELLNAAEARFIYDSITAILRFIKALESDRFGA